MNIIKPFQLMGKQAVLEQANRYHLVISASLGFRLTNGTALLETDAMSESIAAMGDNPLPDMGMPKPKAEYLVSGSYFAPGGEAVQGGEVKVQFGAQQKTLYVFGDRKWQTGVPTQPEKITSMRLDYTRAFGGSNYPKNPVGMGYRLEQLPNVENPDQLITSADDNVRPAGLGPLDAGAEQRTRFQGTYDERYLEQYYPGYPPDFDWHHFMCAADDQWSQTYYSGNETFTLENLHPDRPTISGKLPGYLARCFVQLRGKPELREIDLNLDTAWFFPETDLGLLIWRGGFDVDDDEAEEVGHLMLAYENQRDELRDKSHYESVFAALSTAADPLLAQLGSEGLIPAGEKCAMQILQDNALGDIQESEFGKNMDAKADFITAKVNEKMAEVENNIADTMPAEMMAQNQELSDLKSLLENPPAPEPDADVIELNQALENILPGITADDPNKIRLKDFSFDKIDALMLEIDRFQQKKQALAMAQVEKAQDEMRANLDQQKREMASESDEAVKNLQEQIARLDEMSAPQTAPLPRIDADTILSGLDQMKPQTMEAIQNLQNLKAMGGDDESIIQLEEMIARSVTEEDQEQRHRMHDIESEFKSMYREIAHHQDDGEAPHKNSLQERRQEFIDAVGSGQPVRGQDWSCIDLSGLQLDDIDLSDTYLEQANLSGTSLCRANLAGAILARAKLDKADCRNANFTDANVGAVSAREANFSAVVFNSAILSKGNFSGAMFTDARLDQAETFEIVIDAADFTGADLGGSQLIEIAMKDVNFCGAQLPAAAFLQCRVERCDFSGAELQSSVWADCSLKDCRFDKANLTSACFASTDPEVGKLEQASFVGACLDKANFQGIDMQRSDLSSASMINGNFSSTNLYGANLKNAVAHNTLFRRAILTNADLEKIDLRQGSLAKAHLTGANITGANLYSVDLLRATIGETRFNGSNLDNTILQNWRPS